MQRNSNYSVCRLLPLLSTSLLTLLYLPFAAITHISAQSLDEPQFILQADVQEENRDTGNFNARGNVVFRYPQYQIEGTSESANYYSEEQKLVLMGSVRLNQRGKVIRGSQVICLLKVGKCMSSDSRLIV